MNYLIKTNYNTERTGIGRCPTKYKVAIIEEGGSIQIANKRNDTTWHTQ